MHTKSIQKYTKVYKLISSNQLDQDRADPALSQPWRPVLSMNCYDPRFLCTTKENTSDGFLFHLVKLHSITRLFSILRVLVHW